MDELFNQFWRIFRFGGLAKLNEFNFGSVRNDYTKQPIFIVMRFN